MAVKKEKPIKLPKAANSTSRTYNQYVGANPLGMYNPTGIPAYNRNPWSGALDAADFNYPSPIVPTWGGGWDARNYALNFAPPANPVTYPTYTGAAPTRDFSKTVNANPFSNYTGSFIDPNYPGAIDPEAAANVPGLEPSTPYNPTMPASAQPTAEQPTAGQPAYDPNLIDFYGNPVDDSINPKYDPVFDMVQDQYGKWVVQPKKGAPLSAIMDLPTSWSSSYGRDFYANQKRDDYNQWGLAGGMGKKGTTQLRWNTPTPDWVRKIMNKNPSDNKTYDQSKLDQTTTTTNTNVPGWAGDLVSWRT